jgi:hypothetical protein
VGRTSFRFHVAQSQAQPPPCPHVCSTLHFMPSDYYGRLPRLLRDELLEGRWLPIVGAGLSANAETAGGKRPPMWRDLGNRVADYLDTGYGLDGPVDANHF